MVLGKDFQEDRKGWAWAELNWYKQCVRAHSEMDSRKVCAIREATHFFIPDPHIRSTAVAPHCGERVPATLGHYFLIVIIAE
jgi:hypothetical protein